jgi:hypothetical protein
MLIGIALGGFYLIFGILLLIAAYRLNHPLAFILTFFASNLIILISAAVIVGLSIRWVVTCNAAKSTDPSAGSQNDDTDG